MTYSNSTEPLVSIGIASYNNAAYIIQTLDSFFNQTYPNIEIVVVDDCSTDTSAALIADWISQKEADINAGLPVKRRVQFVKHAHNKGICGVFNTVLDAVRGNYLQTFGSDDVSAPDGVAKLVDFIERFNDEVGIVYSNTHIIDENGLLLAQDNFTRANITPHQGWVYEKLIHGNFIPPAGALIRMKVFEKVGRYDESLSFEDWDMWLRIARYYKVMYLDDLTSYYRVHSTSWSKNYKDATSKTVFSILEKNRNMSPEFDSLIKNRKADIAENIYKQYGPKMAKKWLWKRLLVKPSIASVVLYVGAALSLNYKQVMFTRNE